MATSDDPHPNTASLRLTRLAASFVGGYIAFKLWNKISHRQANIKIDSIHVYPVKSLQGMTVDRWPICKYGLKFDREYMLYNPKTKRFVTQREENRLALIKPELVLDEKDNLTGIVLSAPGMQPIVVQTQSDESGAHRVEGITIWKDKVCGIDQGDEVAKWLTTYINKGREYRLMRLPCKSEYKRETNPKYTPNHLQGQSNASYADGYPYLFVSRASLNCVNRRLEQRCKDKVAMKRFRPNIVITSDFDEAFIEDRIARLTWSRTKDLVQFYLTHPCPRCVIPTIDPETAVMSKRKEPTLTLRTFRSGKHLGMPANKHEEVYFGMNAVHDRFHGEVVIEKGDPLLVSFR